MTAQQLFPGIISGERRRGHSEVADRAARMAGGFEGLGVKQGDSVCILMRNDIAFIEAAYGAMQLGPRALHGFRPGNRNQAVCAILSRTNQ